MRRGVRGWQAISVRMPPDLVEAIDKAAAANGRSREAEIWYRVAKSMEGVSFDAHGCIVKQLPAQGNALADLQQGGQ